MALMVRQRPSLTSKKSRGNASKGGPERSALPWAPRPHKTHPTTVQRAKPVCTWGQTVSAMCFKDNGQSRPYWWRSWLTVLSMVFWMDLSNKVLTEGVVYGCGHCQIVCETVLNFVRCFWWEEGWIPLNKTNLVSRRDELLLVSKNCWTKWRMSAARLRRW